MCREAPGDGEGRVSQEGERLSEEEECAGSSEARGGSRGHENDAPEKRPCSWEQRAEKCSGSETRRSVDRRPEHVLAGMRTAERGAPHPQGWRTQGTADTSRRGRGLSAGRAH